MEAQFMRKFIIFTLFNAISYAQESPKYLFDDLYFADLSVHIFEGKIYIIRLMTFRLMLKMPPTVHILT